MIGKLEWPHLHADLVAKRDALNSVIAVVEQHFIGDTPDAMPASPVQDTPRPGRRGRPPGKAQRSPSGSTSARSQELVTLLRQHGPTSPRDLATKMKVDKSYVRILARELLASKQIQATGKTIGRVLHLPGKPPAKEYL